MAAPTNVSTLPLGITQSSFEVAEYLSARAAFRSPPFLVSRFVLFSSRASVGGGPYVVEAVYPLAA